MGIHERLSSELRMTEARVLALQNKLEALPTGQDGQHIQQEMASDMITMQKYKRVLRKYERLIAQRGHPGDSLPCMLFAGIPCFACEIVP